MALDRKSLEALARARLELKRRDCENSFYEFVKYFWDVIIPDEYVENWHLPYLCNRLQLALENLLSEKPQNDLIINIPPGTTKSTICSIMFPAWSWVKSPGLRFITGSYESTLANGMSVKSRDILKSERFNRLWPDLIEFKIDMDTKTEYWNTKGGGRKTCSAGGNITGFHGHVIMIDDPINPKKAASEGEKKVANDWFDGTLSTRKISKKLTLTVLIMQRLAADDPTGHLLERRKNITHICIPGECKTLDNVSPPELKKFYKNGVMDVKRMDSDVLEDMRVQMGGKQFAGQVLQHPAAIEGTIWKREYWRYYKELPQGRILRKIHSWDTAFKKGKEAADNAAIFANQYENGLYLTGIFSEGMEFPQLDAQIRIEAGRDNPHAVLIEDKASGIVLCQVLRKETTIPVIPIKPEGDKEARAHAATPYAEAGNVYLPLNAPWVSKFVEIMAGFPDIKNKDIPDAFSQLINWLIVQPASKPRVFSRKHKSKSRF